MENHSNDSENEEFLTRPAMALMCVAINGAQITGPDLFERMEELKRILALVGFGTSHLVIGPWGEVLDGISEAMPIMRDKKILIEKCRETQDESGN